MLGIGLAVVTVSAVAVAGYVVMDLTQRAGADAVKLEAAPKVPPPSLGEFEGAFTMLLIGTDECGEVSKQVLGPRCQREDGILNDINLLVHVSAAPRRVTVVSLPRDLMLKVPQCTREDGSTASAMRKAPINTVYSHAGLSCVAKTVSELSGIDIGFAAKLSFDGVMKITDAIGGVEVCIGPEGLHDKKYTGIDWPPGPRTIKGLEALQFIRVRHGIGDNSDLSRISNQQQYMSRLARTILSSETLTDIPKMLRLASTIASNVKPSEELADPVRLAQLALTMKGVRYDDFLLLQLPTVNDPDAPTQRVVQNTGAAKPMWEAIKSGQSMQITGSASHGGSATVETPATPPPSAPSSPTPSSTPGDTTVLSSEITGIDLNQQTCTG
ncbi:MAG: transcriptional regulator [Microbacterium sp. 69-10]|nr:MAG: transcriptional regulator [Microbacterium sp. 69-10]